MHSGKLTKIIATIGPASDAEKTIKDLILNGVNIFRFNMKHNSPEWHIERINLVQKVQEELKLQIGILIDLQGPEIRIETKSDEEISLKEGQQILFVDEFESEIVKGTEKTVRVPHTIVLETLEPGDSFAIDDGFLSFEVVSKPNKKSLFAQIQADGVIKNRKSLNLIGKSVNLPSLIDEDLDKLDKTCEERVDYVALSYVRNKQDINVLRRELEARKINARIVAKIENQQGLDNIDEIIEVSDAIMIARGDLGIETPIEKVAYFQKKIIKKCRNLSKPVIVATQMLQSMVNNPLPSRAEAADVANAAYDKTDCVMLSEESAVGKHPVKAVSTMRKILKFNEMKTPNFEFKPAVLDQTYSIVRSGIEMLEHEGGVIADKVIIFTESGYTARVFSSHRPKIPVIAVSNNLKTVETLSMSFGVLPFYTNFETEIYQEPPMVLNELKKHGYISKGEKLLVLHGRKWMDVNKTNGLSVLEVQ